MMLWVEHYNARVEYFKVRLRHNGDPFGFGLVLEIEILAEYLTNDIQKLVPLWHDRSMLTMHICLSDEEWDWWVSTCKVIWTMRQCLCNADDLLGYFVVQEHLKTLIMKWLKIGTWPCKEPLCEHGWATCPWKWRGSAGVSPANQLDKYLITK